MRRLMMAVLMAGLATACVHAEVEETCPMHRWTDAAGSNVNAYGNTWNVYAANGNL